MKYHLLFYILFIPLIICSQSRDYRNLSKNNRFKFLTDTYNTDSSSGIATLTKASDVINSYINLGYSLYQNDENQIIIPYYLLNFVVLTKQIDDEPFFPAYSIGTITKKVFFAGESIEEGIIINLTTEIKLLQYSNVSSTQIRNFYNRITTYLNEYISICCNNNITSKKNVYNNPFKHYINKSIYSFAEKTNFSSFRNDYEFKEVLKIGKANETIKNNNGEFSTFYNLIFEFYGNSWEMDQKIMEVSNITSKNKKKTFDNLKFNINDKNLKDINIYDLNEMISYFLADCKNNNILIPEISLIKATFEPLENGVLAVAYAKFDDDKIIIKVNPKEWAKANDEKRWYILYHELGHDVLNLDHGQGGKMMFNYSDREYTWDEFYEDKEYMFKSVQ